jgi:pimeloyl-ACP methyl ester carboxylesterase
VPADLDSLANARRCTAPAVVISAGADGVIPARYHRQVFNSYAGAKRLIDMPGAGHDTPLTREAAEQFAIDLDWLWKSATRATSRPASPR